MSFFRGTGPPSLPGTAVDEPAEDEKRVLPRHARARRIAEQSWKEYFRDLGMRTAIILGAVAIGALILKLLFG